MAVQTTVRFVNAPLTTSRGSYATLKVKTAANTSCSIEVDYKSGPSKAAGLGTKSSDGAGNVSWTWKVGATTTRGSWPITVTCGDGFDVTGQPKQPKNVSEEIGIQRREDVTIENVKKLIMRAIEEYRSDRDPVARG